MRRSRLFLYIVLVVPALLAPMEAGSRPQKLAPRVVDNPQLRPISAAKAKRLAAACRDFRVTLEDRKTIPVPWANLAGCSCGDRATLTQYFVATGGREKALPARFSNRLLRKLERNPEVDTVAITLTGPIECKQHYRLPSGRQARATERLDWYSHHGTVVNVDGKLKVIDPSISSRPMAISTWARKLLGKGAPVRHLKGQAFNDAYLWNLGAGDKEPRQIAGYQFSPTFKETSIHPPPGGSVRSDLSGVKYTMPRDLADLQARLGGKVPTEQLHRVQAVLDAPAW